MAADGTSGLSDTGVSMRALLPISGQENRSSIHRYEGFSQVFDTRVVCVRPNITNLEVRFDSSLPVLHGNMSIPSDLEDIATASRVYGNDYNEFFCQISVATSPGFGSFMYHPSDWKMTVCQFDRGAGNLQPIFLKPNASNPLYWNKVFLQKSYLLMNFTGSLTSYTSAVPDLVGTLDPIVSPVYLGRLFNDSIPGLTRQNRADWVDLYRTNGNYTQAEMGTRLSLSLCFSAFQARPLNISASSPAPLVEPRYRYDSESGLINFDDVRKQIITSSGSLEDRGVLALAPQNWSVAWDGKYPYFHWMDVDSLLVMEKVGGTRTIHLVDRMDPSSARADVSIGGLLLDVLRSGSTTAEAVQSMLMATLESRYQDYFFSKGGTAMEGQSNFSAQRANFIAVQIPGGQGYRANQAAGPTQSYLLVMSFIIVHSTIVCIIVVWYLKGMLSIVPNASER
jgi:hypothetical protein